MLVWSGVKTFEISLELGKGKMVGKIVERVEVFRLDQLCCNKVGRFRLCLTLSIKEKRFSLVFPKGKNFLRGWKILAIKLRSIGLVLEPRPLEASKEFVRQEGDGEVVWIESETKEVFNNLVSLKKCLVGRWEAPSSHLLILDFLKSWAQYSWGLKGVGCFREGACVGEVWVRVLGLPMHLWGKEFFKRLGDACEGLFQWTRRDEREGSARAVGRVERDEGKRVGEPIAVGSVPSRESLGRLAKSGLCLLSSLDG
ncbi:hypothetical protein CK203_005039 [Vitis vinifera]|uniref:DUF4283 domain-containing protein n=1 Tax=Vitis vinifera TaxID=29760 RepID=A0A438KEU5_VITVI|nr:hypothetical protein CK203_005039 [Vitis vinifera]